MKPRLFCAWAWSWSAAFRYHATASAWSCGTPWPVSYMTPRSLWACGVTLFRGSVIPHRGFGMVLGHALASAVDASERVLGTGVTLVCGLAVPRERLGSVLRNALAGTVKAGKRVLGEGITLFRGTAIPLRRLGMVLRHRAAALVHIAEVIVREGFARDREDQSQWRKIRRPAGLDHGRHFHTCIDCAGLRHSFRSTASGTSESRGQLACAGVRPSRPRRRPISFERRGPCRHGRVRRARGSSVYRARRKSIDPLAAAAQTRLAAWSAIMLRQRPVANTQTVPASGICGCGQIRVIDKPNATRWRATEATRETTHQPRAAACFAEAELCSANKSRFSQGPPSGHRLRHRICPKCNDADRRRTTLSRRMRGEKADGRVIAICLLGDVQP